MLSKEKSVNLSMSIMVLLQFVSILPVTVADYVDIQNAGIFLKKKLGYYSLVIRIIAIAIIIATE